MHTIQESFAILRAMTIKFSFRGVDIVANSVTEAAALIRELTGGVETPPAPRRGRPPNVKAGIQLSKGEKDSIVFLTAIANNPQGVSQGEMVKLLNAKSPRAVGGVIYGIQNALRKHGFEPNEVFGGDETLMGKIWIRHTKITEALAALKGEA